MTTPRAGIDTAPADAPVSSVTRGRPAAFLRRVMTPVLLASMMGPTTAEGQTILGRILDEVNEEPVDGVIVALVTRDGEERLRALSDSAGRFVLAPPEPGEYHLLTERFGYLATQSPLLALGIDGETPLELMIAPEPLGLEGLEVSVEEQATVELGNMGLTPASLGSRWIDREDIDAIPVKIDMGAIIEFAATPGLQIVRPQNNSRLAGSEDTGLCIGQLRSRTADGYTNCSLIVLNGVPITGVQALDIDPNSIESVAILSPFEATTFYGTTGGSGAVLVWTRRGR